jgi:hypothetical protein
VKIQSPILGGYTACVSGLHTNAGNNLNTKSTVNVSLMLLETITCSTDCLPEGTAASQVTLDSR